MGMRDLDRGIGELEKRCGEEWGTFECLSVCWGSSVCTWGVGSGRLASGLAFLDEAPAMAMR